MSLLRVSYEPALSLALGSRSDGDTLMQLSHAGGDMINRQPDQQEYINSDKDYEAMKQGM